MNINTFKNHFTMLITSLEAKVKPNYALCQLFKVSFYYIHKYS